MAILPKFGLLAVFSAVILISLLLVTGHSGLAIRVTSYTYALLVVIVIAGLLHNDQK